MRVLEMALARLKETAADGWWESLTVAQRKAYIKEHPNSKYAKKVGKDAPAKKAATPAPKPNAGSAKDAAEKAHGELTKATEALNELKRKHAPEFRKYNELADKAEKATGKTLEKLNKQLDEMEAQPHIKKALQLSTKKRAAEKALKEAKSAATPKPAAKKAATKAPKPTEKAPAPKTYDAKVPETFGPALQKANELWNASRTAGKALNAWLDTQAKGKMGLTPDDVKAMPEYKKLKGEYERIAKTLREYNTEYQKKYKSQIDADRKQDSYYGSSGAARPNTYRADATPDAPAKPKPKLPRPIGKSIDDAPKKFNVGDVAGWLDKSFGVKTKNTADEAYVVLRPADAAQLVDEWKKKGAEPTAHNKFVHSITQGDAEYTINTATGTVLVKKAKDTGGAA